MVTLRREGRHARSASVQPSTEHAQVTRALARGGVALFANSGLTAILGVAFWVLAARILTATTVGRGSALVSLLLTVSGLCQLNYARSLSGLIPLAARPRKLLANVYGLTAALSLAAGLACALILPHATADFRYLNGNVLFVAGFVISVALWTIFTLEDTALTSVRRATILPFENGAYGLLKLVCLFVFWSIGYRTSVALFISWVLPLVAIIIPVNLLLFLRAVPASTPGPEVRQKRSQRWVRYDFAGYLLWLAGTLPLPVLVLISVGPAKAASFYVPFTIAIAVDMLSLNLGNTLTAELSRSHGITTPATRSYLGRAWLAIGVLSGVLYLLAPEVLDVFGDKYRVQGTIILQVLAISALPRSVLFLGIAVLRSRKDGRAIFLLQEISALGTLAIGTVLATSLGAVGMALGWLIASCLGALVTGLLLRAGNRRMLRYTNAAAQVPAGQRAAGLHRARVQPRSAAPGPPTDRSRVRSGSPQAGRLANASAAVDRQPYVLRLVDDPMSTSARSPGVRHSLIPAGRSHRTGRSR
jgi:hypothetical protein